MITLHDWNGSSDNDSADFGGNDNSKDNNINNKSYNSGTVRFL